MKLNGLVGKGTGKLGSSVFAVSGGEQIVRQYNPKVSNPNTGAQVEQRAKLKLMSQVAAALASIIAFKKKGLVSARNQFISANIVFCDYDDGKASIDLNQLNLTGSSAPLPEIQGSVGQDLAVSVNLASAAAADVDSVLFALVHETENGKLEVIDIKVETTPGATRNFATQLQGTSGDECIYAYGIKYTDEASRQRYDDYIAAIENENATLDVIAKEFLSGASFTRTRYALI